jgi:hypothetical protein
VKEAAEVASVVIAAFLFLVFVILLPVSVIVAAVRRWFWFGIVARAWATVEQAKNRELHTEQSGTRAREAYRALRDALMDDASHEGGDYSYNRTATLTRIAQSAAALEDELPELKPQIDEILRHAQPNSHYRVGSVRQWLTPIRTIVNRDSPQTKIEPD